MEIVSNENKNEANLTIASVHSSYQEFYSQLNQFDGEYYLSQYTGKNCQSYGNHPIEKASKSMSNEHQSRSSINNAATENIQSNEITIKLEPELQIDDIDAKR